MASSAVHPSRALIVIIMTSAPRAAASDLSTPVEQSRTSQNGLFVQISHEQEWITGGQVATQEKSNML